MDTLQRLVNHFDQYRTLAPPAGKDLDQIMRRGEQLTRRRQAGRAVGVLAITLATLGVVTVMLSNPETVGPAGQAEDQEEQAATTTGTVATETTGEVVAGSPLEWTVYPGTVGDSFSLVSDNGNFYALSTAPGARYEDGNYNPPRALYVSEDGRDWTHRLFGDEIRPETLAVSDGVLYITSTAPGAATPDDFELVVGRSTDGGQTWSYQTLAGRPSPPEGVEADVYGPIGQVVANDKGILASVSSFLYVDVEPLLPSEYVGGAFWYEPTAEGVTVYDGQAIEGAERACEQAGVKLSDTNVPEECRRLEDPRSFIAYRATWDELGMENFDPQQNQLLFSEDGVSFEPVNLSARVDSPMHALASGFVVTSWDGAGGFESQRVFYSADGRNWTELTGHGLTWIAGVGEIKGRLVLAGLSAESINGPESEFRLMVQQLGTTSDWSEVDLTALLPNDPDRTTQHGVTWFASGPAGLGVVYSSYSYEEPTGDSGQPTTTVVPAVGDGEVFDEPRMFNLGTTLLFTADLSTWSVQDLEELTREQIGAEFARPTNLAIGDDAVLLTLTENTFRRPLDDQLPASWHLVATP